MIIIIIIIKKQQGLHLGQAIMDELIKYTTFIQESEVQIPGRYSVTLFTYYPSTNFTNFPFLFSFLLLFGKVQAIKLLS